MIATICFLAISAPAPLPREIMFKPKIIYGQWNYEYNGLKGKINFKIDGTFSSYLGEYLRYEGKWKVTRYGLEICEKREGELGVDYIYIPKGKINSRIIKFDVKMHYDSSLSGSTSTIYK
jgi:hypothetical protein